MRPLLLESMNYTRSATFLRRAKPGELKAGGVNLREKLSPGPEGYSEKPKFPIAGGFNQLKGRTDSDVGSCH